METDCPQLQVPRERKGPIRIAIACNTTKDTTSLKNSLSYISLKHNMKARLQACSRHNLQRMPELTWAQALRYITPSHIRSEVRD